MFRAGSMVNRVSPSSMVNRVSPSLSRRCFSFTAPSCRGKDATNKNRRSGVPRTTNHRDLSLTYEQWCKPEHIGVRKAWNSWNTSSLHVEEKTREALRSIPRSAETAVEDMVIRRFMSGTWPTFITSELIIKRRHNLIVIAGMHVVSRELTKPLQSYYFLVGYSERMLSHILKCPVKLELQSAYDFSSEFKQV